MAVRWVPDPSRPVGGYFVDDQGNELPPAPTYDPATGVWSGLPGSTPAAPAAPAATPAAPPNPVAVIIADWVARHGPVIGEPYVVDPDIEEWDQLEGRNVRKPNPNPARQFTFKDGSILQITDKAEVRSAKEAEPTEVKPQEGAKREVIVEGRKVEQTYTGGQWVTTRIIGPAEGAGPKEGDTRQLIQEGKNVEQTFRGGQWVTTRIIGPVEGTGEPKEGDTRQLILEGRNVEQTYRGGQWVTTRIIGPAEGTGQAKEGDTRQLILEGRNVEQTFRGGQWVTTRIIGPAEGTGQAKEGDTRERILEGRYVTQTYRGGEWVTTKVGDPAVPTAPTVLQTPGAEQEFQQRWDPLSGKVITELNPNYRPKDYGARMAQLSQQAGAKLAELRAKISPSYTAQQAQADFDQWWTSNIDPQMAEAQRAQDTERLAAAQTAMATMQQGAQTGASMLNQRVQSATGAINQINQLVGSNERLTNIPAGLGPGLVSGLQDWITGLGGGQGVYDAAANMVHQANPSLAGTGLGAQAASAISQILERQAGGRVNQGFGQYQPGQAGGFAGLDRSRYLIGGTQPVTTPPPTTTAAPVAAVAKPAAAATPASSAWPSWAVTPIMTTPGGQSVWRYPFPNYQPGL